MDDKISSTMKLMLLMTIKKRAQLQPPGGLRDDSWRVPVGFLAPSDYKGARKPTVDVQINLWGAACGCNCLKRCNVGQHVFSC